MTIGTTIARFFRAILYLVALSHRQQLVQCRKRGLKSLKPQTVQLRNGEPCRAAENANMRTADKKLDAASKDLPYAPLPVPRPVDP